MPVRWRTRTKARPTDLERRIDELRPWYQNIEVAPGVFTKDLEGDADVFSKHDIPGPLWRVIEPDLGDITGKRVLDIGCNAGYMSFACKRLGAGYVLGVDSNLGAGTSFIDQALFCRDALGLDVEFRVGSFFDLVAKKPFDLVLFCGVLYHLENWADALDKVRELVRPETGRVVLESAVEPVTRTYYEGKAYNGDTSSFFVPSTHILVELVRERGFRVDIVRDLGARAIVFMS